MERDKLSFELEIINIVRLYVEEFKQQGISVDSRYLDYYGNQCPKCRGMMKVYNNTVKGLGSISVFMLLEQNKAVLYPLCKSCARKLSPWKNNYEENEKVEEFICSKFPELMRPILSKKDKREEVEKEYKMLEKLNLWKKKPD